MHRAYLTIDDSPSNHTDQLTDFLVERGVPAIYFVRGAFMEEQKNFDKIVRSIGRGIVIGNHSYAHDRTSVAGFGSQSEQILQTQNLIERAYREAGEALPNRYMRFPHMDRGMGGWIIDLDTVPSEHRAYVENLFWDGLRVESTERPSAELFDLRNKMQEWLKSEGFQKLPTPDVTHPWFTDSEMAGAIDAMYTFSTSDWMLTPRHKGNWHYKTLGDLKKKIDTDIWLQKENSAHIILAHDDREDSLEITTSLIDYFLEEDFEFLPIA
ncbi:MAG: polysaccharide deacetylase family protein [Micavibrio aeruginosavorus]|uniref:Polysaccharide deacetylase family protein n=1 Tax=Micavibrio aeruginosavorus TaxID=349221 RepID=A0A2W5FKJ3_9BACT|nr:MAG: polysaccharide deacetylase family protein [Micavibrio aeruginosavorus]